MKSLAWLLVVTCAAVAQESKELRVVNGIAVDVAPVRKWLVDRQGDRPMKHWKVLNVDRLEKMTGAWDQCVVRNESGQNVTVLIASLPPALKPTLETCAKLQNEITRLSTYHAKASKEVAVANAVTPVGAAGTAAYVDAVMNQRAQVNLASLRVEELGDYIVALKERLEQEKEKSKELRVLLAMFTGKKYAGLEIWDCGKQQ
jgi:hypothetical protein